MKYVALIDCNNFFVSCERVFNPSLSQRPVVVLSSNDGCAIALSDEAKNLGIKRGEPYFKIKDLCSKAGVKILSGNMELYADMSSRVMSILQGFGVEVEVYSIDEAFMDLSTIPSCMIDNFLQDVKSTLLRSTGIPVSIGVSTTKTLAKLAQIFAKKSKKIGIYKLLFEDEQEKALKLIDVGDIWGIGRNLVKILRDLGINNAFEFKMMDQILLKKYLGLPGQKIQFELNNVYCSSVEQVHEVKKSITVSKSLKTQESSVENIEYLVSEFTALAAEKMRRQSSMCRSMMVFMKAPYSARFKENISLITCFEDGVSDTPVLIKAAKNIVRRLYYPGLKVKKVGIVLMNLADIEIRQMSFCMQPNNSELQKMIDLMNSKMGKRSVFFLAQGLKPLDAYTKRQYMSKCYTTKWSDIPMVF